MSSADLRPAAQPTRQQTRRQCANKGIHAPTRQQYNLLICNLLNLLMFLVKFGGLVAPPYGRSLRIASLKLYGSMLALGELQPLFLNAGCS